MKAAHGKLTNIDVASEGYLKKDHMRLDSSVSVDYFESRIKGRTFSSFERSTFEHYVGGCIFADHIHGYLQVEHQLGFLYIETIRGKYIYEKCCLDHGIIVDTYLFDNEVFKANAFVNRIREHTQIFRFRGVNAHHQNGIAERVTKTASDMSRAMMSYANTHWKDGINFTVWPMAITYAIYIYNHMLDSTGIGPANIFAANQFSRHKLKDAHVVIPSVCTGSRVTTRTEPA